MRTSHCTFVLAVGLLACGAEGLDKGLEDDVPTDGKYDSFRAPTEHGLLRFGIASSAEITDEDGYHAWSFTVDAAARVDLRVTPTTENLDTVLYVYRKGTAGWGEYLERNDDFEDGIGSGAELDLEGGEYRILVKGFKRSLRGRFEVEAGCSGAGCGVPADCSTDVATFAPIPPESGDVDDCRELADAVAAAPVTAESMIAVTLADRCRLGALQRRAVEYYVGYWDADHGWEEFVEGNTFSEGDPVAFDVRTEEHGAQGTVVRVDFAYGEEIGIRFTFDAAGELLFLYQDNQSPDERGTCG